MSLQTLLFLHFWCQITGLSSHKVNSEEPDQTGHMSVSWLVETDMVSLLYVISNWMKNDLCIQRRLISAWASTQSDKLSLSTCQKLWVLIYPLNTQWRLIKLGGYPGWSVFTGCISHILTFVVLQIIFISFHGTHVRPYVCSVDSSYENISHILYIDMVSLLYVFSDVWPCLTATYILGRIHHTSGYL